MSNEDVKESGESSPPGPPGPSGGDAGGAPAQPSAGAAAADPPAAGGAATTADESSEALRQRIERAEGERAEAHDRMLRVAADFDNYKKRVRRELDDATARAREQVLREILPVLDNFERAILALDKGGSHDALVKGVKMVEKQLHAALEKFGVKGFDARGEVFDPTRHEAIQQVESAEQAPGTVADVFARGYMVGDRLLRPAMVSVAKAPPQPAEGDGDAGSDAPTGDGDARSD